ncbi:DUF5677 domain-containing protein [Stenotrophomonas sp. HMSC10F06]|uniref:DUF5677 domain-containing protein n=1 Tax=Stenotrophomonas sp. HMSC10F06 TaxID=1581081 RepID=UPI0011130A2F|nr:DUF5677 domain-containing protein [Stenotrophomonas sp. HMSC10F06]
MLPNAPKITDEQMAHCRENGDFRPVLFEWYKFTSSLCNFYACLRSDSPAVTALPPRDYAVLIGLLNRMSRLMFSNVALSHEGLFGETTAIIDRCIFESSIKLIWLCETENLGRFDRFIADGLKTELKFKAQIESNIAERGDALTIETRMLHSIEQHIHSSDLDAAKINDSPKLPDLASMIDAIRRHKLLYLIGQKIGSHHVHGTWPSLRLHYLEEADGVLAPRDHNCSTHVNQYVFVPLIVLDALRSFVRFVLSDPADSEEMIGLFDAIEKEIKIINTEVVGNDFEYTAEV